MLPGYQIEAFNNRGTDYRISHDIEDIIYVIDNRTSIVEEVLLAHIHPSMIEERLPIVEEKITRILEA